MRRFAPARLPAHLLLLSVIGLASPPVLAQSGPPPASAHVATPTKPSQHPVAPPVLRPHGPIHPTQPSAARQPHAPLPLPLPPPPPEPEVSLPTAAAPAPAKPEEPEKPTGTGLPLPRFAALRSDDVNLRAGPGTRYPIEWVYKRRDLPMEIEREFEVWRLVKDPDGTRGWVHQATLTGRRTFMVQGADATLRSDPKDDADAVAILKVGVIGTIRSCAAGSDWCRVQVGDYRGYLKRSQFWGTLPDEVIVP
jgi:SH3-like domain-containing protein